MTEQHEYREHHRRFRPQRRIAAPSGGGEQYREFAVGWPASRRSQSGELSCRPTHPCASNQTDVVGGGTSATVSAVSPATVATFDPTAPFANSDGFVASPNVDLAD